jgi:hypothetical protein
VAILAASAPALKPFFKRFLIDPISSIARSSTNKKDVAGAYRHSRSKTKHLPSSKMASKPDPDRVGSINGDSESNILRDGSFERELDDSDPEVGHFELRQSCDGVKMVPIPPSYLNRDSSVAKECPTRNLNAEYRGSEDNTYVEHQPQNQTREQARKFSQPHSYKSSTDTTADLLPEKPRRSHSASQMVDKSDRVEQVREYGPTRTTQVFGSVRQARLQALLQLSGSTDESIAKSRVDV